MTFLLDLLTIFIGVPLLVLAVCGWVLCLIQLMLAYERWEIRRAYSEEMGCNAIKRDGKWEAL